MIVKQGIFGRIDNNCFLIVDEKTNKSALVDCTEYSDKMLDLIGDTDLEYILLTHGHYDHILGAKQVKEKYGAKLAVSKEDASKLVSSRESLAVFHGIIQDNIDADILLSDGDTVNLGDIEIKVISTPGHTKGSICFIAENYLFAGDTLFYLSCGRTDFPDGSDSEMLESLKRLKNLEGNFKVMTGHEEKTTLDFERKHNPYMRNL